MKKPGLKTKLLVLLFVLVFMLSGCGSSGSSSSSESSQNSSNSSEPTNTTAQTSCFDVTITYTGSSNTASVCATSENNQVNGLGVYRFIRFALDSEQSVTFSATRTSGLNPADPDIQLLLKGKRIGLAQSTTVNTETLIMTLAAGDYVLLVYDDKYTLDTFKISDAASKQAPLPVIVKSDQAVSGQITSASCTSASTVTLSGAATFDRVPHKSNNALDYTATSVQPIKQAVVELLCDNAVIMTTNTDSNGNYSFAAPTNISNVFVRVKAKMLSSSPANYDVTVVDNTQSQSLYAMDSAVLNILSSDIANENLHAASGWSIANSAYTSTRVAAPFAILDSIYLAMRSVIDVDANVVLPALRVNWSVNNTTSSGSLAAGQIGTSHYNGVDIYILGAENNDTDEYDEHVIIHEWGHYFEDKLSRSDSVGGSHSGSDILDIRVAFSEGFGNALSGIASGKVFYRDAMGAAQTSGFGFDIDSNTCTNAGWYSECSVQSVLYDLFDQSDDGADAISLGFLPLYNVLTGAQVENVGLTSLFSFIWFLKNENSVESNAIDNLVSGQNVDVITDMYGDSELTNNPGSTDQLPVFTQL